MLSVNLPFASAQPAEELLCRPRPRNFRERSANASDGVRIASAHRNLAQARRQPCRILIRLRPHLPVARFKRRDIRSKPAEIFFQPPSRQSRENMIHTEEELLLRQVHHQRNKVFTTALNLNMVAFSDAVDAEMHLGAAWHLHGGFLA